MFRAAPAKHWPRLLFYYLGWALFRLFRLRLFDEQRLPLKHLVVVADVEGNCGLNFLYEMLIRKNYDFEPLRGSNTGVRTLFDVGANCGFYSILCCSRDPELKAVCFEPQQLSMSRLQHNVVANRLDRQISVVKAAVGARAGECTLRISANSSLAAVSTSPVQLFEAASEVQVKLITLDEFAQSAGLFPDLIKVDVEGFEVEVLRGSEKCLQHARYLIVEHHSRELKGACESLIRDAGFRSTDAGTLLFAEKIRQPVN